MSYYTQRPYHALDLNSGWSVFPEEQNKIATYGRFKCRWETKINLNKRNYWDTDTTMAAWISIDNGSWIEYTWEWKKKNCSLSTEFDEEARKVRTLYQKERTKETAKKRKILNEELAASKGITVQELMAEGKKKRVAKQEQNKGIRIVKDTANILKAGPVIKALRDDLTSFLEHLNSGGEVNIVNPEYKLRSFKEVQYILKRWRTIPKSRQKQSSQ